MKTTIICIAGLQPGAGATTTAVSLAHGLSLHGRRVLLTDLAPNNRCTAMLGLAPEPESTGLRTDDMDAQGNTALTSGIRFSRRHGLHLLSGRRPAEMILSDRGCPDTFRQHPSIMAWQVILINTSPAWADLQERAIQASDLAIIPTATDPASIDGLAQGMHRLGMLQERKDWHGNLLGILPTFYDAHAPEHVAAVQTLHERFPKSVLPVIHRSVLLETCTAAGWTIFETDPLVRAAKDYLALIRIVRRITEGK